MTPCSNYGHLSYDLVNSRSRLTDAEGQINVSWVTQIQNFAHRALLFDRWAILDYLAHAVKDANGRTHNLKAQTLAVNVITDKPEKYKSSGKSP